MILRDFFAEAANPADTLYFFDVEKGGRSFNHLDLKILGLKQSQKGKWYYQPGRDSTDLLTNASIKYLEKTLNVPARAWRRPIEEACWKGYHKDGMKTMFGKRYPNCVKNKKKNEDVAEGSEQKPVIVYTNHRGATIDDNIKKSLPSTLVPFNKLRMWEKHKSMKDPKIADWVTNKLLPELKQNGVLKPLLVWNDNGQLFVIDGNHRFLAYQVAGYQGRVPVQIVPENMITVSDTLPGQQGVAKDTIQEFVNETLGQKNSDEIRRIQQMLNKKFNANLDVDGVLGPLTKQSIAKFLPSADTAPAPDPKRTTAVQGLKNKSVQEQQCPKCGGPMFSELMINEKQDACYYKVKSRYKVWPSAYASGALVQCRKKGAANWGNKSKK